MSVVQNIKAMSSGVGDLNKQVKELAANIKTLGSDSLKAFGGVKGLLGMGGARGLGQGGMGNVLSGALGNFSTPSGGGSSMGALAMGAGVVQGGGQILGGMAQIAMAPLAGAYNSTMDTSGIINRAGSYYQATLRAGSGLTRAGVEAATFKALNGGLTGIGSDAAVANILATRGYTVGTTNYLGAVAQVGGAANYLGMSNQAAAQAIAGFQSGPSAANMYQYGITTMNPDGTMKSVGDIARQFQATFGGGMGKLTPENISMSALKGNLGGIYAGLGYSQDQQQMITQALIDLSQGKNPDLASASAAKGNQNPFSPLYQMNASQTGIQGKSEAAAVQGLATAAGTVTAFNKAMGDTIASLEGYRAYLDGLSGTNAGKGIKAGGKSFLSGVGSVLKGVGTVVGTALMAAAMVGGGNPGYGASFSSNRKGPRGGGTPGAPVAGAVTAAYGAKDNSGIWASTNNTHLGTDFAVPVGTPVYSPLDGIVSSDAISSDYGNAILIDHPNGYSTLYAHLSNKEVSPGARVFKGQEIGKSGKSGNTTGPSLHYEVRKGKNNPVDPSELGSTDSVFSSAIGQQAALMMGGTTAPAGPGSVPNNKNVGTAAQKDYASQVLSKLGVPVNANNINNMLGWMKWEGGMNHNNPLNTTWDLPDSTNWNSVGVKTYKTMQEGVDATVKTLTEQAGPSYGYDAIIGALKTGKTSYSDFASAVNNSKWGTTIKGGGNPGYGADMPTPVAAEHSLSIGNPVNQSNGGKNVYITIKLDEANESNAVRFANRVQAILEEKNNRTTIGSA